MFKNAYLIHEFSHHQKILESNLKGVISKLQQLNEGYHQVVDQAISDVRRFQQPVKIQWMKEEDFQYHVTVRQSSDSPLKSKILYHELLCVSALLKSKEFVGMPQDLRQLALSLNKAKKFTHICDNLQQMFEKFKAFGIKQERTVNFQKDGIDEAIAELEALYDKHQRTQQSFLKEIESKSAKYPILVWMGEDLALKLINENRKRDEQQQQKRIANLQDIFKKLQRREIIARSEKFYPLEQKDYGNYVEYFNSMFLNKLIKQDIVIKDFQVAAEKCEMKKEQREIWVSTQEDQYLEVLRSCLDFGRIPQHHEIFECTSSTSFEDIKAFLKICSNSFTDQQHFPDCKRTFFIINYHLANDHFKYCLERELSYSTGSFPKNARLVVIGLKDGQKKALLNEKFQKIGEITPFVGIIESNLKGGYAYSQSCQNSFKMENLIPQVIHLRDDFDWEALIKEHDYIKKRHQEDQKVKTLENKNNYVFHYIVDSGVNRDKLIKFMFDLTIQRVVKDPHSRKVFRMSFPSLIELHPMIVTEWFKTSLFNKIGLKIQESQFDIQIEKMFLQSTDYFTALDSITSKRSKQLSRVTKSLREQSINYFRLYESAALLKKIEKLSFIDILNLLRFMSSQYQLYTRCEGLTYKQIEQFAKEYLLSQTKYISKSKPQEQEVFFTEKDLFKLMLSVNFASIQRVGFEICLKARELIAMKRSVFQQIETLFLTQPLILFTAQGHVLTIIVEEENADMEILFGLMDKRSLIIKWRQIQYFSEATNSNIIVQFAEKQYQERIAEALNNSDICLKGQFLTNLISLYLILIANFNVLKSFQGQDNKSIDSSDTYQTELCLFCTNNQEVFDLFRVLQMIDGGSFGLEYVEGELTQNYLNLLYTQHFEENKYDSQEKLVIYVNQFGRNLAEPQRLQFDKFYSKVLVVWVRYLQQNVDVPDTRPLSFIINDYGEMSDCIRKFTSCCLEGISGPIKELLKEFMTALSETILTHINQDVCKLKQIVQECLQYFQRLQSIQRDLEFPPRYQAPQKIIALIYASLNLSIERLYGKDCIYKTLEGIQMNSLFWQIELSNYDDDNLFIASTFVKELELNLIIRQSKLIQTRSFEMLLFNMLMISLSKKCLVVYGDLCTSKSTSLLACREVLCNYSNKLRASFKDMDLTITTEYYLSIESLSQFQGVLKAMKKEALDYPDHNYVVLIDNVDFSMLKSMQSQIRQCEGTLGIIIVCQSQALEQNFPLNNFKVQYKDFSEISQILSGTVLGTSESSRAVLDFYERNYKALGQQVCLGDFTYILKSLKEYERTPGNSEERLKRVASELINTHIGRIDSHILSQLISGDPNGQARATLEQLVTAQERPLLLVCEDKRFVLDRILKIPGLCINQIGKDNWQEIEVALIYIIKGILLTLKPDILIELALKLEEGLRAHVIGLFDQQEYKEFAHQLGIFQIYHISLSGQKVDLQVEQPQSVITRLKGLPTLKHFLCHDINLEKFEHLCRSRNLSQIQTLSVIQGMLTYAGALSLSITFKDHYQGRESLLDDYMRTGTHENLANFFQYMDKPDRNFPFSDTAQNLMLLTFSTKAAIHKYCLKVVGQKFNIQMMETLVDFDWLRTQQESAIFIFFNQFFYAKDRKLLLIFGGKLMNNKGFLDVLQDIIMKTRLNHSSGGQTEKRICLIFEIEKDLELCVYPGWLHFCIELIDGDKDKRLTGNKIITEGPQRLIFNHYKFFKAQKCILAYIDKRFYPVLWPDATEEQRKNRMQEIASFIMRDDMVEPMSKFLCACLANDRDPIAGFDCSFSDLMNESTWLSTFSKLIGGLQDRKFLAASAMNQVVNPAFEKHLWKILYFLEKEGFFNIASSLKNPWELLIKSLAWAPSLYAHEAIDFKTFAKKTDMNRQYYFPFFNCISKIIEESLERFQRMGEDIVAKAVNDDLLARYQQEIPIQDMLRAGMMEYLQNYTDVIAWRITVGEEELKDRRKEVSSLVKQVLKMHMQSMVYDNIEPHVSFIALSPFIMEAIQFIHKIFKKPPAWAFIIDGLRKTCDMIQKNRVTNGKSSRFLLNQQVFEYVISIFYAYTYPIVNQNLKPKRIQKNLDRVIPEIEKFEKKHLEKISDTRQLRFINTVALDEVLPFFIDKPHSSWADVLQGLAQASSEIFQLQKPVENPSSALLEDSQIVSQSMNNLTQREPMQLEPSISIHSVLKEDQQEIRKKLDPFERFIDELDRVREKLEEIDPTIFERAQQNCYQILVKLIKSSKSEKIALKGLNWLLKQDWLERRDYDHCMPQLLDIIREVILNYQSEFEVREALVGNGGNNLLIALAVYKLSALTLRDKYIQQLIDIFVEYFRVKPVSVDMNQLRNKIDIKSVSIENLLRIAYYKAKTSVDFTESDLKYMDIIENIMTIEGLREEYEATFKDHKEKMMRELKEEHDKKAMLTSSFSTLFKKNSMEK